MRSLGETTFGSATIRVGLLDAVLMIEYLGPLTVRGWLEAARYAVEVGEPYRYRGMFGRMDRAVMIASPLEVSLTGFQRSALAMRRVPGALIVKLDHRDMMNALSDRMAEGGHLRRVFTDAIEGLLWIRREAAASPVRRSSAEVDLQAVSSSEHRALPSDRHQVARPSLDLG